MDIKTEY